MSKKKLVSICVLMGLIAAVAGVAKANWSETFNNNAFDLTTWDWGCYPQLTGTFTHTITDRPDTTNDYLTLRDTPSVSVGGSAFGMGMGNPADIFTDVRFGAVVNVMGDASHNVHVLGARTSYFISPGEPYTPYPGLVSSGYCLLINWANGPANLYIEVQKYVNLQNMMKIDYEVVVPGLAHNRSYYAELDVVGSDPVYVTGSLYEYKGGPLVAKLPTLIDTSANDPWEDTDVQDAPFTSGVSGIGGMNENPAPPGYRTTFDDVFSISNGPAAVNPGPADGATGVSINADLSWKEAAFAKSRDLWFGKKGDMQKVTPSPTDTTYDPGPLEFSQAYQWRVDEIGSATVTGHLWSFTTAPCLAFDDFESYADNAAIAAKWVDNITGVDYVFLDTGTVHSGSKAMRLEYQNQYLPYFTEATQTFVADQNWTANGIKALSLFFRGRDDNVEEEMYVKLEDAGGKSYKVFHPYKFAVQSNDWEEWTIDLKNFSDASVILTAIKKVTIGLGDETNSGQAAEDRDTVYIDDIQLCPCRCFNSGQLDLRGDANGDCEVNFEDLAVMANGWLNDGSSAAP
jgi:hypothetical protein